MTRIILWGAYPATLASAARGECHVAGFGDNLLWWLPPVLADLETAGFQVVGGQNVRKVRSSDLLLLFDRPAPGCRVMARLDRQVPPARRILLRLEPAVISPKAYREDYLRNFGALVRVEDGDADDVVSHVVDFTVPAPSALSNLPTSPHRAGLIAISSHKRIAGPRGEMYRVREKAYRYLSNVGYDFQLFGQGWSNWTSGFEAVDTLVRRLAKIGLRLPSPDLPQLNYKGVLPDKACLRNFRYSLVIENSLGKRYISEKIFDSLKYGVVPIYIGPRDVVALGLGEIVRQISSVEDLEGLLPSLGQAEDNEAVATAYARWLESQLAIDFLAPRASKLIISAARALNAE